MRTMMVRHKYFKIEKLQEDTNAVLETTALVSAKQLLNYFAGGYERSSH